MIEIALSKLKNSALFTLSMRVYELIFPVKTPEMGIDLYFNLFTEAYTKYREAMEKAILNASETAQKDSFRDQMWSALRTHVKNYLRHPDFAAKAQAILAEIDKNGLGVAHRSYEEETAIIQNVTTTLDTQFADDLTEIQGTVWLDLLKQANADFETTQHTFNTKATEARQIDAASTARPELQEALRKLLTFLPMQAEVSGNSELATLVKQLETEVSRF